MSLERNLIERRFLFLKSFVILYELDYLLILLKFFLSFLKLSFECVLDMKSRWQSDQIKGNQNYGHWSEERKSLKGKEFSKTFSFPQLPWIKCKPNKGTFANLVVPLLGAAPLVNR